MAGAQAQSVAVTGQDSFENDCLGYFTRIYRYVRASVGNDSDAEDLTQDVFVQAFSKVDQFKGGDLEAWLYRIARNKIAMHYRRKGLEQKGRAILILGDPGGGGQVGEESGPEQSTERCEFHGASYRALALLDPLEQEAIRLKFARAFENVRIAELLNISPGHLGVLIHRALRKMRRQLERWGHGS